MPGFGGMQGFGGVPGMDNNEGGQGNEGDTPDMSAMGGGGGGLNGMDPQAAMMAHMQQQTDGGEPRMQMGMGMSMNPKQTRFGGMGMRIQNPTAGMFGPAGFGGFGGGPAIQAMRQQMMQQRFMPWGAAASLVSRKWACAVVTGAIFPI